MQDTTVSKIKDKLDVVEVLSGYIKVQKAGINFKGRCPFHNEKTPSFFISPERQIWHCFGCAKGGDMFEFVKEIEGVEFPEAVRILAQKAGVEIEAYRGGLSAPARDAKAVLLEITERSTKFFEKQFQSNTGKLAYQYLIDRGLTPETIKEFRLGFAPNDWEALSEYLSSCGHSNKEIVEAGMAIKKEDQRGSRIYDRFRSRIMFPIFEANGQVVGFTGRVFELSSQQPTDGVDKDHQIGAKYVNTPQTLIYDKSRVLYGLNKAKMEIKQANQCILVEGNMDALMSYQAGVRNVVASSGTALTPHHLRLLQRYTTNLGFCFDTDQAGAMATKRGIGLALSQNFNIKVVSINDQECKDPADYVKKYGPKWSEIIGAAKPVLQYYFDAASQHYDPTSAESKKTMLLAVAPFIKRLVSNVEKNHWMSQLALLLRTREDIVEADIKSAKDEFEMYEREAKEEISAIPAAVAPVVPPDNLNEAILSVALKNPSLISSLALPYELLNPHTAKILQMINGQESIDFTTLIKSFEGPEAMHLEFAHLRAQELWKEFSDTELQKEFQRLLVSVRRRALTAQLTAMELDIKQADMAKDSAKLTELASRFTQLAQELTSLHYEEEKTN